MGLTDTDKLIESLTRKSIKEEILGFHESASLINSIIDEVKNIPTYDIEDVYNKAIDDFVKFASDMPIVEENGEKRPMWLEEMAEQLKKEII